MPHNSLNIPLGIAFVVAGIAAKAVFKILEGSRDSSPSASRQARNDVGSVLASSTISFAPQVSTTGLTPTLLGRGSARGTQYSLGCSASGYFVRCWRVRVVRPILSRARLYLWRSYYLLTQAYGLFAITRGQISTLAPDEGYQRRSPST